MSHIPESPRLDHGEQHGQGSGEQQDGEAQHTQASEKGAPVTLLQRTSRACHQPLPLRSAPRLRTGLFRSSDGDGHASPYSLQRTPDPLPRSATLMCGWCG
ncbi:hypothetical protein GCM10020000_04430 [Streptomyces olivoverticillatus]